MSTSDILENNPADDVSTTLAIPGSTFQQDEWTGPCCEKCGAAIRGNESLVCKKCGWYASIGAYVEIDQSWEAAIDPELAESLSNEQASESSLFSALPQWAWLVIACITTVIVESIVARLATPSGSYVRMVWSVTQFFVGAGAFVSCHVFCFAILMREESNTNFTDIFIKPLKTWSSIFRELPRRQWVVQVGFSGLTAALMSILVIGGLPYHKLLDWGFKQPPKQDLMGAIMSRAQQVGASQEMGFEEALSDFAGKGEDMAGKAGDAEKPNTPPRETTDGVILGYEANDKGLVFALHLGAEHKGKLLYVGRVTPQLSAQELRELSEKLAAARTKRPFINLDFEAHWVAPKFLCRINYKTRNKRGGMEDVQLEELLGEVKVD